MIVSRIGVFAATTYTISSNKVSYTDNSSLGVDNVQAALDGTCSNISSIQDQINSLKDNDIKIAIRTTSAIDIESVDTHLVKTLTFDPVDGTIVALIPYLTGGFAFSYSVNGISNGTIQMFVNSSTTATGRRFNLIIFYK